MYETKDELRAAVEKRLGHAVDDEAWASSADWTPPYDDADIQQLLSALNQENSSVFVGECERLGKIISYELEAAHRTNPDWARILNASQLFVRPLGEFWAWSWFYAHQCEQG